MKKRLLLLPMFVAVAACNGGLGDKGHMIARIDGKPFTEEELDLRLNTLSDEQREAILANPEEKRNNFENILRTRLYALAGQRGDFANVDSLKRRLALIDQRVMTQYYFDAYINENGGQSRKDLETYYRANPSKFTGDSGKVLPFSKVSARVADSLLLSHANIDSFYQASRNIYVERANCLVSIIQTSKLKDAQAAVKAIQGGMSFGDAAAKFSTHATKISQGKLGKVVKGEGNYDIGSTVTVDSLLFNPETRLKEGQVSGPIRKDSATFVLVRSDSLQEERLPPLASVGVRVLSDYVRTYKEQLSQNAMAALKAKYKAKTVSPYKNPSEADIKSYYEQNQSDYESPETFELYHIEISNKDKVAKSFKSVKDLNGFKALAAKFSENKMTKAQSGYLGVIKRDFCLPYGVGMLPELFTALDTIREGKISTPVESPDTQKWHFFWLVKKEPRKVKTLERVHALVMSDMAVNRLAQIKPTDTLAVYGDGKVLRESDVIFLKDEIPPQMRERYTRDNLVEYLLTWRLATDEAMALGLTDEKRLIALRLQNEDGYWSRLYQDSIMTRSYEEDSAALAKLYKEKRGLFTKDSADNDWHRYSHDIAGYLMLTPQDFNIEYYTNPERYRRDTVLPALSSVMFEVFQNLKSAAFQRLDEKILKTLKTRFDVQIVDGSLNQPSLEPVGETYKKAQNLHYDRKLDQALGLYGKLRDQFPARTGLQDSVCFGIAQIYIEQERYQQALAEYRRVSYLYPNSANNYKAMFMVGFIQSEHLKNDSAAVQSFESMLAKYPNTDLSDDADWMIRNIRSGGKLMPVLEGDSASTPADSTSGKKK